MRSSRMNHDRANERDPRRRAAPDPATDAFKQFMRELRRYPLLTHERHLELLAAAQSGDREAMQEMVNHNMRLVVNIAKHYHGYGLPVLDLIQEGAIGLMRAIEKYDLASGHQFSTYATWWVRQGVTRALGNDSRIIRLPIHQHEKLLTIKRKYENDPAGRDRALAEVRLDIQSVSRTVSLDEPFNPDPRDPSEARTLADVIPASDRVIERAEARVMARDLLKCAGLTKRETIAVALRFGLGGESAHTLDAAGERMGISRERVRQLQDAALKKLKAAAGEDTDALLARALQVA